MTVPWRGKAASRGGREGGWERKKRREKEAEDEMDEAKNCAQRYVPLLYDRSSLLVDCDLPRT